jgi:hypothetical protein
MDDPLVVRVGDGVRHRQHVGHESQALLESARLVDQVSQRTAGHHLHGVERLAAGPAARLVDGHDAGMLEARRDQRLAHEARLEGRAVAEQQLLEGDRPVQAPIVSVDDAAEAAPRVLSAPRVVRGIDGLQLGGVDGGARRFRSGPASFRGREGAWLLWVRLACHGSARF